MRLDPIVIVAYDPAWVALLEAERTHPETVQEYESLRQRLTARYW